MYGHEPTIFILGVNTHMATMQPQTNMNTGQQMNNDWDAGYRYQTWWTRINGCS